MRRLLQALKRLLLFCGGLFLGLVSLTSLGVGAEFFPQDDTWFSGYNGRIVGLSLIVQGAVGVLGAALSVGRAIIPLKLVPAPSGTPVSGSESATTGGGPVLPICAIPILYFAFVCFMVAQGFAKDFAHARKEAEESERMHSPYSQARADRAEEYRRAEQANRTFGILSLVIGGTLLAAPLFLKRRVWQLGWRINGTGVGIALGGLLFSGMAFVVWLASRTMLHNQWEFYSRVGLLGVLVGTLVTVLGGIKAVAGKTPPKQPWYEGANYPSPVQKVLVFDYYDGPTNGVLKCADGQVYCFDLLAREPDTQDVRIFGLSPMPPKTWEQLNSLCGGHGFRWQEQLRQPIEDILRQADPVEWVIAAEDLQGEILGVKAIRPDELAQVTDWNAVLGLEAKTKPFLTTDDTDNTDKNNKE